MTAKKKHHPNWGGKREGAGSAPMYASGAMAMVGVRMTQAQRETFKALGGSQWLRDLLDKQVIKSEPSN